ncbi:hypothetical protein D9M70_427710 [compost metagenome]
MTCRKQGPGLGTRDVQEAETNTRCRTWNATDTGIAFVFHATTRSGYETLNDALSVDVEHSYSSLTIGRSHKASLDREWANGREHVAAVGREIYPALGHVHLGEQVVHICVRATGASNDGHFAGKGVTAANAVHLKRMAGAH